MKDPVPGCAHAGWGNQALHCTRLSEQPHDQRMYVSGGTGQTGSTLSMRRMLPLPTIPSSRTWRNRLESSSLCEGSR